MGDGGNWQNHGFLLSPWVKVLDNMHLPFSIGALSDFVNQKYLECLVAEILVEEH